MPAQGELTVSGHLVDGGTEARQRAQNVRVDLSRVGLSSDGVSVSEAEKLSDPLVECLDLLLGSAWPPLQNPR